jgi:glycine oxidase
MHVVVIGAGAAGLAAALECVERGAKVQILERGPMLGARTCSWLAGGMLAPWCERESAEPSVVERGQLALEWWPRRFPETVQHGTLVVAPHRDESELARFARRTQGHEPLGEAGIAGLEPDLAGRFRKGLFFAREAHLDPRRALAALVDLLEQRGVAVQFGVEAVPEAIKADFVLDCRGFAARDRLPDLRGVRGEMAIVRTHDIALSRPVRLLHPRFALYVVPRGCGFFMIGATMIESEHRGAPTLRSTVELLNGAYALHPAFGEAEVIEIDADIRPAFPDNLPRITREGRVISLNGLFRHGFLLSPALAREAADLILPIQEVQHDPDHQWRGAGRLCAVAGSPA